MSANFTDTRDYPPNTPPRTKPNIATPNTSPPPVRFSNVSHRYGSKTAIDDLTFALNPGGITALLGLNGAGKTTAIRVLLGLIRPTDGDAKCFDQRPGTPAVRQRISAMLQQGALPDDLTVFELLRLFASYYRAPLDLKSLAQQLALEPLLSTRYVRLSGGQQRLTQFALALVGNPQLLVLDEPTTGLDPDARAALWAHVVGLAEKGRTILVTTHYLEEADRLADRVLLIHQGRLVADASPGALKSKAAAKQIRCRTQLDRARLETLPNVASVQEVGADTVIDSLHAEDTLRALLSADESLHDLRVTGGDLESAIRVLTKEASS